MSAIGHAGGAGGGRPLSGGFAAAPGAGGAEARARLEALVERRTGALTSAGLHNQGTPAAEAAARELAPLLPNHGGAIVVATKDGASRALDLLGGLAPEVWAGCLAEIGCGAVNGEQTNPTMGFWQLEGMLLCHPDLMARFVEQAGEKVGALAGLGSLAGEEARLAAEAILFDRGRPPLGLPLRDLEAVRRRLSSLEVETPGSKAATKTVAEALKTGLLDQAPSAGAVGRALDALGGLTAPEWLSCLHHLGRSRYDGQSHASQPFAELLRGLAGDPAPRQRFADQCAANLGQLIGTGPLDGTDALTALDVIAPGLAKGAAAGGGGGAGLLADRLLGEAARVIGRGAAGVLGHVLEHPDGIVGRVTGLGNALQAFGLAPDPDRPGGLDPHAEPPAEPADPDR